MVLAKPRKVTLLPETELGDERPQPWQQRPVPHRRDRPGPCGRQQCGRPEQLVDTLAGDQLAREADPQLTVTLTGHAAAFGPRRPKQLGIRGADARRDAARVHAVTDIELAVECPG